MRVSPPKGHGNKVAVPDSWQVLIDSRQAAAMLHVSLPTLDKWRKLGRIRPVTMPFDERRVLYRRADVEAFVDELAAGHAS